MADKLPVIQLNKYFDLIFTLDINEWNGEKFIQLRVIDCKAVE